MTGEEKNCLGGEKLFETKMHSCCKCRRLEAARRFVCVDEMLVVQQLKLISAELQETLFSLELNCAK